MTEETRDNVPGGEDRQGGAGRPERVYAPAEIQRSIKRTVQKSMGAFDVSGLVVEGTLGEVGDGGRYPYIYGVQLLDPVEEGRVELTIPRRLADRARMLQRSSVRVRGDLEPDVYKGKLSFRLSVREVDPADPTTEVAADARDPDKRFAEIMKSFRRGERRFPVPRTGGRPVVLDVIHPSAGVVLEDFVGQLGDARRRVKMRTFPVSMGSPGEVLRAVRASRAEVVVIVRGGGSPEDFEALNDPRLAEAWMEKGAFTVCAVGHSTDGTVLDPLSDVSCPTPTAAGSYVRARLSDETPAPSGADGADREPRRLKLAVGLLAAFSMLLLALLLWSAAG